VPTRHLDLQFVAVAPRSAIAVSDESLDLRWWPVSGLPAARITRWRTWFRAPSRF
jgi:hypothetical protein